eukprot:CAMPEP_0117784826 /NCGR_PEP_ID=MMETSP0948-20121206/4895_1 /TAXON_ID=44440 /ORGANISM="Chattonella subsalsa, Strain CCMP2191" /LENGTH=67 /DNA_ID=CAMNT_0005613567 /DNA_START=461 /DNA_END=664 /DNA_ORIENTATION=+
MSVSAEEDPVDGRTDRLLYLGVNKAVPGRFEVVEDLDDFDLKLRDDVIGLNFPFFFKDKFMLSGVEA